MNGIKQEQMFVIMWQVHLKMDGRGSVDALREFCWKVKSSLKRFKWCWWCPLVENRNYRNYSVCEEYNSTHNPGDVQGVQRKSPGAKSSNR